MSPFLGSASVQSRQCVSSGPVTGNFWSTMLIPEQGIQGGGVCPDARRGTTKKLERIATAGRNLVRFLFSPFGKKGAVGYDYPHRCVGQVGAPAAGTHLRTPVFDS